MPNKTNGDLLSNLTQLLELDEAYDPTADSVKLASAPVSPAPTNDKTAALQDEIAQVLAEHEKTAGGNFHHLPGNSATAAAKGTQAQQTVPTVGHGIDAKAKTPHGTEIAAQTDADGLSGPKGSKEQSANDSTDSSGMPGPGQEAAAAKTAQANLGLVAQALYTDLTEGAIERMTAEEMGKHAANLSAARARLAARRGREEDGDAERGAEGNEDAGSLREEEANEKQAQARPPVTNRFLSR